MQFTATKVRFFNSVLKIQSGEANSWTVPALYKVRRRCTFNGTIGGSHWWYINRTELSLFLSPARDPARPVGRIRDRQISHQASGYDRPEWEARAIMFATGNNFELWMWPPGSIGRMTFVPPCCAVVWLTFCFFRSFLLHGHDSSASEGEECLSKPKPQRTSSPKSNGQKKNSKRT